MAIGQNIWNRDRLEKLGHAKLHKQRGQGFISVWTAMKMKLQLSVGEVRLHPIHSLITLWAAKGRTVLLISGYMEPRTEPAEIRASINVSHMNNESLYKYIYICFWEQNSSKEKLIFIILSFSPPIFSWKRSGWDCQGFPFCQFWWLSLSNPHRTPWAVTWAQ